MGRWVMQPFRADGLRFQKMMGCGQNFGVVPDLSTYVFLGVWDTKASAERFFGSSHWQKIAADTRETGTLYLQPLRSHGSWDGQNPFDGVSTAVKPENPPIAVLTRATIRWGALLDFWRHVPQARQPLKTHASDLLFAIGAGEKPWVQQCTISVWKNEKTIEQFAYRQSGHKEVIRRTRQKKWYSEELFARFAVVDGEGVFANVMESAHQPAETAED